MGNIVSKIETLHKSAGQFSFPDINSERCRQTSVFILLFVKQSFFLPPKKIAPFGRDFDPKWLVLNRNCYGKCIFSPPQAKFLGIFRLKNDFPLFFVNLGENFPEIHDFFHDD